MKELRIGKKYFVCKSVNVLSKLMQKGFFPACTKESEWHDGVWLWYFNTTEELINELRKIFDGCEIKIID